MKNIALLSGIALVAGCAMLNGDGSATSNEWQKVNSRSFHPDSVTDDDEELLVSDGVAITASAESEARKATTALETAISDAKLTNDLLLANEVKTIILEEKVAKLHKRITALSSTGEKIQYDFYTFKEDPAESRKAFLRLNPQWRSYYENQKKSL